jgi:tripeptidyl-peptidase-1
VTVVAASGDDGVSGYYNRNPRYADKRCGYNAMFPVSSPYILAVGGTMGTEKGKEEIACSSSIGGNITTGGGFSTLSSLPAFQSSAVNDYLLSVASVSSSLVPVSGFNAAGRGYPDISALATKYLMIADNELTSVAGTSASAPVIAGMISLLNKRLISKGKAPLGWFHPLLYSSFEQYTKDIVEGDNKCSAESSICCSQGFYATKGW